MNRHLDFSRPTLIQARTQPIADDLFPSPDGGLDLRAPVVARGCLPAHAARLGNTAEGAVALGWRGVSGCAWHRCDTWRHNHRRLRVMVSDSGVNTILIIGPIAGERS